jgi:hypothetical protein
LQQNIVADFSMKNGRENRTNGNQEKGKEEKETLSGQYDVKRGTLKASPKFFVLIFGVTTRGQGRDQSSAGPAVFELFAATMGACFSRAGHNPRNAQKLQ